MPSEEGDGFKMICHGYRKTCAPGDTFYLLCSQIFHRIAHIQWLAHKSFLTIRVISFPLIPEVVKFNKENKYSEIRIVLIPSFALSNPTPLSRGGVFLCWSSPPPTFVSSHHCLISLPDKLCLVLWSCACLVLLIRLRVLWEHGCVLHCLYPPPHWTWPCVHRRCSFTGSYNQQAAYSLVKNIQETYV